MHWLHIDGWEEDGIDKLVFSGHGSNGVVYPVDMDSGGVAPAQVSPPYHLSAVAIFACESSLDSYPHSPKDTGGIRRWRHHVSTNGKFTGTSISPGFPDLWKHGPNSFKKTFPTTEGQPR